MRYFLIENDTIVNVIAADGDYIHPTLEMLEADGVDADQGWTRDSEGTWYPPAEPAPTVGDVNAERDRRLVADFEFAGTMFQRDAASVARISGAGTMALGAMVNGALPGDLRWHGGATDFAWIASDNTLVTMDAQTCFAFGQAAAAVESSIVFAAKALRGMDPIPADYRADAWWT